MTPPVSPEVRALETLDADGAIQETSEAAFGTSRSDFLRKAAVGGGGLLGGSALLGGLAGKAVAAGTGNKADDIKIGNFALTLEYLEAEFYVQALRTAGLQPSRLRVLTVAVRNHELAHVKALKGILGSAAVAKPRFNFGAAVRSVRAFHSTAIVLEDTGVAAYGGQVAAINSGSILSAAAQILAVEARHAAAFRQLKGQSPAPLAFNPVKTAAQIKAAVLGTNFIQGAAPGLG